MTALWGGLVWAVMFAALRTWRAQPLYCDDGNWFYYAVFRRRGVRLNRKYYPSNGYFGVPWIASLWPFGRGNQAAFYDLKACWQACTGVALYALALVCWGSVATGLAAAGFYLLWVLHPRTRASLTYADHFIALPLLLSLLSLVLGRQTDAWWYFAAAGLLAGWAAQIKIVSLPGAALEFAALCLPGRLPPVWCAAGFLLPMLAPLAILREAEDRRKYYSGYLLPFRALLPRRKSAAASVRATAEAMPSSSSGYVELRQRRTAGALRSEFAGMVWPVLKGTAPQLVLAGYAVLRGDVLAWCLAGLLAVCWGMAVVQKSFHGHTLQVWAPTALLAGRGLVPALSCAGVPWLVAALLLAGNLDWLAGIVTKLRRVNRASLADYPRNYAIHFDYARVVGEYVRAHARPGELMVVWGNMPSIYLYAGVQAHNTNYIHLYPNGPTLHSGVEGLFITMRRFPPEWVVFYNGYLDKGAWNMERLNEHVPAPYRLATVIDVQRDDGKTSMRVPVYRRNDDLYRPMVRERARHGFYEPYPPHVMQRFLGALSPGDDTPARQARELLEQSRPQDVLDLLLTHRNDPEVLVCAAEACFALNDAGNALRLLDEALALNPYCAEAHNDRGVLMHALGKRDEARKHFTIALRLLPGYAAAAENQEQP